MLQFAPEGRDAGPLKDQEIERVRWVIDNQAAVRDAMLERLFDEYPGIRELFKSFFGKDERKKSLPKIRFPEQFKELVGVHCIHVHLIAKDGKPFIGVELGCTWDAEHGVGVRKGAGSRRGRYSVHAVDGEEVRRPSVKQDLSWTG